MSQQRAGNRWSENERFLLFELYGEYPTEWVAERLGRSMNAVRKQAALCGIRIRFMALDSALELPASRTWRSKKQYVKRPWLRSELNFLRRYYPFSITRWMATQLKRTPSAIRKQAAYFSINKLPPRQLREPKRFKRPRLLVAW
ncbi:MAG: hypothetical protein HZC01_02155 [Candidatus Kerfeldbacteria bacterium]|nr:hypothetical protein [Candidatus Kerfeldbacteria bacterium]